MFFGPVEIGPLGILFLIAVEYWLVTLLILLLIIGVMCAGAWKSFQKAGYAGWKALVPIYNIYILADAARLPIGYAHAVVAQIVVIFVAVLLRYVNAMQTQTIEHLYEMTYLVEVYDNTEIFAKILAVSTVFTVGYIVYKFARKYRKGLLFTFGLLILPFIFWPILGFSSAEYEDGVFNNVTSQKN